MGSAAVYNWLFSVCFITKSFLTYSFVLPAPTLSTICRPLSSYMCSITPETVNVGSSYSHMRGPGVGCWLSDRSNCRHWSFEAAVLPINLNIYTDQWEPIVIYHSITLTGRYTTMQPTLLTSWRLVKRDGDGQRRGTEVTRFKSRATSIGACNRVNLWRWMTELRSLERSPAT